MGIKGKVIVFTGKISKPRYEFQALVEERGGISGLGVTSKTDYLVVGEKPGSKLDRAKQYGTKIISEEDFLKLLQDKTEDEEPLEKNQREEIEKNLEVLTCNWCKASYRHWKNKPNYETCPVCEASSKPRCPICRNLNPTFVTDYLSYYCSQCKKLFPYPYSSKTLYTKHIHIRTGGEKCIFCGSKDTSTYKTFEGQGLVNLREQRKDLEREERVRKVEREDQALKFLNSLSEDQLIQLEEQLKETPNG